MNLSQGKLLLFSYAFPPLKVQMAAPVVKAMKGLVDSGYSVDVLCADEFSPFLGADNSLVDYANQNFKVLQRLRPDNTFIDKIRQAHPVAAQIPDLMGVLHKPAFRALMDLDLTVYDAVFTWSPFHSINSVMERVKKYRPSARWVAQFSDPWARNPIETNSINKLLSLLSESSALNKMDYVIHSSPFSRELMFQGEPKSLKERSTVIPHVFDRSLYPESRRVDGDRIALSYIGVLFGKRSPEPLFRALGSLFKKRPELSSKLCLRLVGFVPESMLNSDSAKQLPQGVIEYLPGATYLDSLKMMVESDILMLIEADTSLNLFVPSKLFDYMGAERPIIGMVPKGGSEEIMKGLGASYARPSDVEGIMIQVENAVNKILEGDHASGLCEEFRQSHDNRMIADRFIQVLNGL